MKCDKCNIHFASNSGPIPCPRCNQVGVTAVKVQAGKPGTELKNLIGWFASETKGCDCKNMQKKMDRWGVEGCKIRKSDIVDHLLKEGKRRRWPTGKMSRLVASVLVTSAINKAKKVEQCQQ